MMKPKTIAFVLCVSLVAAVLLPGCITDPKEKPNTRAAGYTIGDRTQPEHCIGNLVQAYADRKIELIEELFHEEYIFVLQEDDVPAGAEPFIDRADDIRITGNMFLAADGQFTPAIEELDLKIDPGAWVPVDKVAGQQCDGCMETERNYTLEVVIGQSTYLGNDIVKFIVVPADEDGETKYKIRIMYDIPEN